MAVAPCGVQRGVSAACRVAGGAGSAETAVLHHHRPKIVLQVLPFKSDRQTRRLSRRFSAVRSALPCGRPLRWIVRLCTGAQVHI